MSTKKHYVNNKDFCAALIEYKAKRQTDPTARVPAYIGICIQQICNRLSTKPNFSGYSYKDEMISDGLENCLAAVGGFNAEKSVNAFAYFTQIAWNAFIRRIQKEKKETYIKHKNMQNMFVLLSLENSGFEDFDLNVHNNDDIGNHIIESFENKLTKTKKHVNVGLEKFIEETP